jgi:hypothetical protein
VCSVRWLKGNSLDNNPRYTSQDIRFTLQGETLCAIFLAWPGTEDIIASLECGQVAGKVIKRDLLGHAGDLAFKQEANGLKALPRRKNPAILRML